MNDFERVKEAYDLLDFSRGLTMMRKSGKVFKGLCPIHGENTPSFTVDPAQQLFYCHGCGTGGDIIKLVELTENVGSFEALERLAERKDIQLSTSTDEGYERRKGFQKKQKALIEIAHGQSNKKEAVDYILSRGFTQETVTKFHIGYGGQNHSIIIPLVDHRGLEIGYAERFIGDPPAGFSGKYRLPSENPESSIYNELFKKTDFLFNEHNARKAAKKDNYILVFEGQLDSISADQIGFESAVACMQSSLTKEQAQRLDKIAGETNVIVLVPDRNKTGMDSIEKNYELIKAINSKRIVKVLLLPLELDNGKEMDFNDFVSKRELTREQAEEYITFGEVGLIEVMLYKVKDISIQHQYAQDIAMQAKNIFVKEKIAERLAVAWDKPVEKVSKLLEVKPNIDLYDRFKTIDDMRDDFTNRVFNSEQSAIRTGYEELDNTLNSGMGIPTGWVTVFLARSAVGKTAFALNVMHNAIRHQSIGADFFSFEQQGSDIYPKLVAIHEEMNQKKVFFEYANFSISEYHEKISKTYKNNLLTWEYSRLNIGEIEQLVTAADERFFDEHPCKLVVVDYLGYIKTDGKNRYEELSNLTAELKQVAKRTNKMFLILAQTSRGEKADGSKPVKFSDARDSGTIEENADILLGAYRPELDMDLESKELIPLIDDYHIQVLKNRGGPVGKDVILRMDKQKQILRPWRDGEKDTLVKKLIGQCMNLGSEAERINYAREAS